MWEKIFAVLLNVAVSAPSLIENAELAFSGKPGSGAAKKKFVMDNIGIALGAYQHLSVQQLPPDKEQLIMDTSSMLIETGVTALKAGKKP